MSSRDLSVSCLLSSRRLPLLSARSISIAAYTGPGSCVRGRREGRKQLLASCGRHDEGNLASLPRRRCLMSDQTMTQQGVKAELFFVLGHESATPRMDMYVREAMVSFDIETRLEVPPREAKQRKRDPSLKSRTHLAVDAESRQVLWWKSGQASPGPVIQEASAGGGAYPRHRLATGDKGLPLSHACDT